MRDLVRKKKKTAKRGDIEKKVISILIDFSVYKPQPVHIHSSVHK